MMTRMLARILRALFLRSGKLLIGVQARWHSLPAHKPRIYYANHASHLDGIVIWSYFPKAFRQHIHPIAANDYWGKSRWRQFIAIDVFNSILINRKVNANTDNPVAIMSRRLHFGKQGYSLY